MSQTQSNSRRSKKSYEKYTAAQLKKLYENKIKNFEIAESAVRKLREASSKQTKIISVFNKQELRELLESMSKNESRLRKLSWFLYYRSQIYARICNFYANMFCLDCRSVIPNYGINENAQKENVLKSYEETLDMLDNMRLQQEMRDIYLTCFIQDVFYGIVFYDETGIFILPISADYAKIIGKYMTGDFSYCIDMTYFDKHEELLKYFPDPIGSMYEEHKKSKERWIEVPQNYSICLKWRSEDYELNIPPLTPIFNSIINLTDLEDIQAVAAEQEIYKLIWLEMETCNTSGQPDDWKISPDLVVEYFNKMLNGALPEYISAAIVPGKLSEISFPNDTANDTTKVVKATETVLNTAGGAEILNGATISNTYAFKMACIQNTEYAISSLLPQTQSWVNRFLRNRLDNPCKVKFFPISVYTKQDYKDQLLSAGQNGLPTKLAYNTINGFSEKDTLSLNFLEEDVLKLGEKLKPFSTSYTQSSKADGYTNETGQGAPEKDVGELSDSGERSRNQ